MYYANYLKYIERARTELVRALGVDQSRLKSEEGLVFAVRRVEADYQSPAKFDDQIHVLTEVHQVTGARVILGQDVLRGAEVLFSSVVTLVMLTSDGKPARIPADIRQRMKETSL